MPAQPTESAKSKGESLFRKTLLFAASPGVEAPIYHWQDRYPEGTQIAAIKTDGGYQVELGIPASRLDEAFGSEWKTLRWNLFYTDIDNNGTHKSQIYWRPDWRNDDNIMGSGMFKR